MAVRGCLGAKLEGVRQCPTLAEQRSRRFSAVFAEPRASSEVLKSSLLPMFCRLRTFDALATCERAWRSQNPRKSRLEASKIELGALQDAILLIHCSPASSKRHPVQVQVGQITNMVPIWRLLGSILEPSGLDLGGFGQSKAWSQTHPETRQPKMTFSERKNTKFKQNILRGCT